MFEFLRAYGYPLVFLAVLGENLGLPLPSFAVVLAAASLAAEMRFSLAGLAVVTIAAALLGDDADARTPLQQRLARFGQRLAIAVLAICMLVFLIGMLRGAETGACYAREGGALVPTALGAVRKGGRVVCGGIHMSDIPSFPYALLWGERSVQSVANLTRADGEAFMRIAAQTRIHTEVHSYPLAAANEALADLRAGRFNGAAALVP